MTRVKLTFLLVTLILFIFNQQPAVTGEPDDWPQWFGPNRDGLSKETGIIKSFPEGGPKVIWTAASGDGYSAITVVGGWLYTTYGAGDDEVSVCLDAATGEEKWRFRMDSKFTNNFGHGSRSTPSIDGGLVYVISAKGKLFALDAKSGKEVWGHDLVKEYGAQIPQWGVSTSPLVYKKLLIVDVGGRDGHGIVAFNKKDGTVVWKSATELPGYSAPIAVSVNGTEQIICFTGNALISVSPKDGRQFWRYAWKTDWDVNAATPVFVAPDMVFISSGYNKGGVVLKMVAANGTVKITEVWKSKVMRNHFSSSLLIDGYLYGFDEGTLKCVDVKTQEVKWGKRGFKKGSLTYADGHLIVLSERGVLALVEATPSEFVEKGRAGMLNGRCWTVPTLVNGRLYIRNQKEMKCLDFSAQKQS